MKAIRDDMVNTGADWVDEATGVEGHLISARTPADLGPWMKALRDIVGRYLDPPQAAMVLAVDEKSQIQALDRTAPLLPMMPG